MSFPNWKSCRYTKWWSSVFLQVCQNQDVLILHLGDARTVADRVIILLFDPIICHLKEVVMQWGLTAIVKFRSLEQCYHTVKHLKYVSWLSLSHYHTKF